MGEDGLNGDIAARLLAAAAWDGEVRAALAATGALFGGYHPEMEAVHAVNAAMLQDIIATGGWPDPAVIGEEATAAAWLIAQHAIGLPAFQRACLIGIEASNAPRWQMAMLEDRIRGYEGRLQRYGTSFDWDDNGILSPSPIEDEAGVDARRAAVGLPPLADAIARHRASRDPAPASLDDYRRGREAWRRAIGWTAPLAPDAPRD